MKDWKIKIQTFFKQELWIFCSSRHSLLAKNVYRIST